MSHYHSRIAAFLLACLYLPDVSAQETASTHRAQVKEASPQLELTARRAVIFKDGYFLIVKEATGTTDDQGNIYTDDVPDAAVLGSFWAIPQSGTLKAMVSGWVNTTDQKEIDTEISKTIELVEANIDSHCSVKIGNNTTMTGKLLKVLGAKSNQTTSPTAVRSRSPAVNNPPGLTTTTGTSASNRFLLRTKSGDVMIDASRVQLLSIENMKTSLTRQSTQKQRKKQMRFEFDKPNQKVKLSIMYFRPGARWIPTYRVDLADQGAAAKQGLSSADERAAQGMARLTLQGELINEAEDLVNVPIDIVVGVPNFRFRNIASPLVLESVLRNALVQAAPQLMNQGYANNSMMLNNYISSRETRSSEVVATDVSNLPSELTTKSRNDLFLHSLSTMTLRKGERAAIQILTTDVPYRDVYTWDITVKHAETIAENSGMSSPLSTTNNTVWRQIELVNTSKIPWTTGAAMMVNRFQPLAQELLTYTPSGGTCRIPVTIAVDLQGQVQDRELKRDLEALRFARHAYAKVSGQIDASIKNHKNKPVDIEVAIRFGGKGDRASDEGAITSTYFQANDWHNYGGDPAVNNSTQTTWTATIGPGASFTPSVEYHFYTRH